MSGRDLARVEIVPTPEAVTVRISGEIDLSNAHALRETIDRGCERASKVICDLREIEYADSAGVALLLGLHRDLARRGVPLVLVAPPGSAAATILHLAPLPGVDVVDGGRAGETATGQRRPDGVEPA